MKKKIIGLLIMIIMLINTPVFADVGDFETYDSGFDWGGSDYSSWSSRDYDYDDDDDYYSGRSYSRGDSFGTIIIILIILVFVYYTSTKGKKNPRPYVNTNYNIEPNQTDIINRVKAIDELFNADDFTSWVRDLFIKLQYAWSDRDWSTIRCFETNELYEQHYSQLQRYIQNKQINKMERVSVNWVKFLNFEQSGDKDVLTVILNSKMTDYIIDEETEKVLKGDKNSYNLKTYKLTFVRKKGVKTKEGQKTLNTTNCPNCGAPTEITSAGKCSYCGSVITTGEFDWVLSNLEPYRG